MRLILLTMKLLLIATLSAILFKGSGIQILYSEPVALIVFGICLIGMAKIGRSQIKSNVDQSNWQSFMFQAGNSLFKKKANAK